LIALAAALATLSFAFAACGGDDDDETATEIETPAAETETPGEAEAAALYEEISDLPDEQQIERVGEAWAGPFAAEDEAMCGYLHPDLGCSSQLVEGALTGSTTVQRSFAGATVSSVKVNGKTAIAVFSNGERVEFQKDPDEGWGVTDAGN
jgi:hypothetical protein